MSAPQERRAFHISCVAPFEQCQREALDGIATMLLSHVVDDIERDTSQSQTSSVAGLVVETHRTMTMIFRCTTCNNRARRHLVRVQLVSHLMHTCFRDRPVDFMPFCLYFAPMRIGAIGRVVLGWLDPRWLLARGIRSD
jgi:hypothetical protein